MIIKVKHLSFVKTLSVRRRSCNGIHLWGPVLSPSPTVSRRASCQLLLVKEWALNTGTMPQRGLPRNNMVKVIDWAF